MNKIHDKVNIKWLSEASEINPNPVLIMNLKGEVLYRNVATDNYLNIIFPNLCFPRLSLILPSTINEILSDMHNNQVDYKDIEYEVVDAFFKCKIVKSIDETIYNLYLTNITKSKNSAFFDTVTQLPNSIYLNKMIEEEVKKCKKSGSCFTLLRFNIINFKNLSYALGYDFGEHLLLAVADKLKNIFSTNSTIARFSDHDFAVLLPQIALKSARVRADSVIEVFEDPLIISSLRIEVAICSGIAEYPRHGVDAHAILQCADVAMHKAQKLNSTIEFYDKDFFDETTRKIKLATELHNALATDELSIVYQPKVDIQKNTVVGVEALMRWSHPSEGFISPEIFIEVAEQSRLIKEITIWVLNRTLKEYQSLAAVLPNIQLSVNITAKDLTSETFPEIVAGLLAAWNIDAEVLTLEITENALITDTEQVLSIISRLTNIGIKLSIDDFGTGYSSLNYLRQLNVNELKIDKSFVMDMLGDENNQIIVRAVTSLAHDLNLKVTAEGVENKETLYELNKYRCDIAQGYYLSKPLSLKDIIVWIKNYS